MSTLTERDIRCMDTGCHERMDCERWLQRNDAPPWNQSPSLFPHDLPLVESCPMRIPVQPAAGGEA
jgi:hypothetical protein